MFDKFEEFYRSDALADVVIAVDGKTINAHRIVLSAGSDYFRRVLTSIKLLNHTPVLFINDIAYDDMETILEFIYRGQIVVTRDKVESLRQAAYKLRIKGFENFLRKPFVTNRMAMGNQLKMSNGAMRSNMTSMLNVCFTFLYFSLSTKTCISPVAGNQQQQASYANERTCRQ